MTGVEVELAAEVAVGVEVSPVVDVAVGALLWGVVGLLELFEQAIGIAVTRRRMKNQ